MPALKAQQMNGQEDQHKITAKMGHRGRRHPSFPPEKGLKATPFLLHSLLEKTRRNHRINSASGFSLDLTGGAIALGKIVLCSGQVRP